MNSSKNFFFTFICINISMSISALGGIKEKLNSLGETVSRTIEGENAKKRGERKYSNYVAIRLINKEPGKFKFKNSPELNRRGYAPECPVSPRNSPEFKRIKSLYSISEKGNSV